MKRYMTPEGQEELELTADEMESAREIVDSFVSGIKPNPKTTLITAIVQAAQRTYFRDGLMPAATMLARKADEYDMSDSERLALRDVFMSAIRG